MSRVSADKPKAWETRPERPSILEIVLLKRTYLLPWSQFLYAEGDNDELRIAFPMHEITIRGTGLQLLLPTWPPSGSANCTSPSGSISLKAAGGHASARSAFRKWRSRNNDDWI